MKKKNKEKIKKIIQNYQNIRYCGIVADSIEHSEKLELNLYLNLLITLIDIIIEESKE